MTNKLPFVSNPGTREQRLRRLAARQGLRIRKYRGADPTLLDTYMLVNADTMDVVKAADHGRLFGLSLDDVEAELKKS